MNPASWIKRKLDIDPGRHPWEIPEVLWWRLKEALLWDDFGLAEVRSIDRRRARWRWFTSRFLHWLRTGYWQLSYDEPVTEEQKHDLKYMRGFRLWLVHILMHRETDYECAYCWEKFPAGR
jgi:hypothetical protein